MRCFTVLLLSLPLLSMGLFGPALMPAVADQPAASQSGSKNNEPLPLYQPPKKLTPRARVGGGLRGTDGTDPVLVALVPDHVGLTGEAGAVLKLVPFQADVLAHTIYAHRHPIG